MLKSKHTDTGTPPPVSITRRPAGWQTVFGLALVALAITTPIALLQYGERYAYHEPRRITRASWWLKPIELNVSSGLPSITGNLNTVALQPGTRRVWIAGDAGLLAFSEDDGGCWVMMDYDAAAGVLRLPKTTTCQIALAPAAGSPAARPVPSSKVLRDPMPTVYAAALQAAQKSPTQNPNPPAGQQQQPAGTKPNTQQQQVQANAPGIRPVLGYTPSFLAFRSQVIGKTSPSQMLTLSNAYDTPATFQGMQMEPPKADFSVTDTTCAKALAPGAKCTLSVVFHPAQPGPHAATLVIKSDARNNPVNVTMSGTGVALPSTGTTGTATITPPARSQPAKSTRPGQWTPPALVGMEFSDGKSARLLSAEGVEFNSADGGASWEGQVRWHGPGALWLGGGKGYRAQCDNALPPVCRAAQVGGYSLLADHKTVFRSIVRSKFTLDVSTDQGLYWQKVGHIIPAGSGPNSTVSDLVFQDTVRGWAVVSDPENNRGILLKTRTGGQNWNPVPLSTSTLVRGVAMGDGGSPVWVAGDNGEVLRTTDGGATWIPVTRSAVPQELRGTGAYWKFLPPWYLLGLILCIGAIAAAAPRALRVADTETISDVSPGAEKARTAAQSGIADKAISDKPLEPGQPDALELGKIAAGLSLFLRNPNTVPPLVIAVNGKWGSGKSSLMNLLQADLQREGSRPVWFNAWHHQKEEQLLAALLQVVRRKAVPPLLSLDGVPFRWRLLMQRARSHAMRLLAVGVVLALLGGVEWGLRRSHLEIFTAVYRLARAQLSTPSPSPQETAQKLREAADAAQALAQIDPASAEAAAGRAKLAGQLAEARNQLDALTKSSPQDAKPLADPAAQLAEGVRALFEAWGPPQTGTAAKKQTAKLADLFAQVSSAAAKLAVPPERGPAPGQPDTDIHFPWVSGLVSVLGALAFVGRALTAFGANPAALLATIGPGKSLKELDAQTSFRDRFSREFGEVTQALGRRPMLILIDDLDRCRPEKVREVLEAVNFLSSSGACFLVLGMDREIVEHCVGLSFRRVVDSMPAEKLGLGKAADAARSEAGSAMEILLGPAAGAAQGVAASALVPAPAAGMTLAASASNPGTSAAAAAGDAGNPGHSAGAAPAANNPPTDTALAATGARAHGTTATPATDGAKENTKLDEIYDKRMAFAGAYLQKLVQIGVSIPVPTPAQQGKLFAPDEPGTQERGFPLDERKAKRAVALVRKTAQGLATALPAILAVALIAVAVASGQKWLAPYIVPILEPQKAPRAAVGAGAAQATTETSATAGSASAKEPAKGAGKAAPAKTGAGAAGGATSAPNVTALPAAGPPPKIEPGQSAPSQTQILYGLFAILLVGSLYLIARVLMLRPGREARDSPDFLTALEIWRVLVLDRQNTPRAAKRFVNRVRYLAMRQQALKPLRPPLWERWVRRMAGAPAEPPAPAGEKAKAEQPQAEAIPDTMLVALAAMDEYVPQWFRDTAQFDPGRIQLTYQKLFTLAAEREGKEPKDPLPNQNWESEALKSFRTRYLALAADIVSR